ncbi:hypothetical protein A2U01_0035001, partial [Trifolium medium]|nr:hypothetical protein [Trifolium medium]
IQNNKDLVCLSRLASISELKARQVKKFQGQCEHQRVLARTGELPSLGEISLARRALNVLLAKFKNKGVARRAFIPR